MVALSAHRDVRARALRAFVLVLLLCGFGAACQPTVRTAPFRERPDSLQAGDLRGPFDGRVVEAASDKPVAGALVYATWSMQSGYGMSRPYQYKEYVTSTDANGEYRIPRLEDVPGRGSVRLTDFHVVIYKRGYVAYRSDRRFSDMGTRHDFAQSGHRVALEPWREEYSHVDHLRYVGGGPALATLTAWEAEEAANELSRPRTRAGEGMHSRLLPTQRGAYLVAAQLLSPDDVKQETGFDGELESGPLGDEPDTTTYSSQHLKAIGRPENYDVALRIWRLEPDEADANYNTLVESLPSADQRDEIADRSLRATEGPIYGVAFVDQKRGIVALLTCGQGQCNSSDVAARIAQRVFDRIQRLWPLENP